MKTSLFICLLIFSKKLTFSQNNISIDSQQTLEVLKDSVSVVISPGTTNESIISDIETLLKTQQGISYHGYLSNHNIYILSADVNLYASAEIFYNNFKLTSGITTLLLKEGGASSIVPYCEFKTTQKLINPEIEKALLDK
jgi:hypothetical protein